MHFFQLKVSTFFSLLLLLLHAFAIVAVIKLQIGIVFSVLFLGLILESLYSSFKHAFLTTAKSVRRLACFSGQPWVIEFNNLEKLPAIVLSHSIVTRYFMCLYLQPLTEQKWVLPVIIWFDSVGREQHQQIRRALAISKNA